jgi:hypothetical protein
LKGTLRIGAGAGYSGDRVDPAVELADKADLDYLVFECLAERTIALAQLRRLRDPEAGFDPLLEERMRAILPTTSKNGTRIVTNMGQANPEAAARRTAEIARELGISGMRVVALMGDDVLEAVAKGGGTVLETGEPVGAYKDRMISANAYLGAEEIVRALQLDPDVVITGRVADPSLFLAPMIHEFAWSAEDHALTGQGTVVGHLLECAGQLTGGYFADPVAKPVEGMANLGFPYAVVEPSGGAVLTKLAEAGGEITLDTCKEQLLYEIGDPARYLTPDVTADFTSVELNSIGKDAIRVSGGDGAPRPDTLKVAIGFRDGFLGEGQISYAGPNAAERARLAAEIVTERLDKVHRIKPLETRVDYIGESSAFRSATDSPYRPVDVRLRVAAKTRTLEEAELVGREVQALYTNGPAGGGGARKHVEEIIGVVSTLIDRQKVGAQVQVFES